MSFRTVLFLGCVFLSACTTVQQKKPTQWNVKATTEGDQKIWVTRADGSRQCAPKPKNSLPAMVAAEMKAAGVLVYRSRLGHDGQVRSQNCGSPTGATVDLEISRSDLNKALGRGFVTKTTASE